MNPKLFQRPEVIGKFELLFPRKHVALPFDVERFEEGTVDFGVPLGERLRWLAIWAEGMAEWSVLETLYSLAQGSDAACADVLHSWGLAAMHEAWRADSEDDRRQLLSKAREVIGQGIEQDSGDSGLYCLMGRVLYHDRSMPKEEAMVRFREALSIAPDSFMARMFLAHCLQDLGRWEEALDEFRKIDPDTAKDDYEDPTSVLLKLEEHMGHCLTKLGRLEDAVVVFRSFLSNYEQADACVNPPDETIQAVATVLQGPLEERLREVLRGRGEECWFDEALAEQSARGESESEE